LKSSTSALSAEGPGKLCGLLATCLLGFECLLCALCRAFKTGLTHLSGSTALLFHHVAGQFGFRNRLARPAKRASANGLGTKLLFLDLTCTSHVCQRLLNRRILVLVHECASRGRIKRAGSACQTCNTLLRRSRAQSTGGLQSTSCVRSNATSASYGLLAALQCALIRANTARCSLLCRGPRCVRYATQTGCRACCAQTSAQTGLSRRVCAR